MITTIMVGVVALIAGIIAGALIGRNNKDEVEAVVARYNELLDEADDRYDALRENLGNEIGRLQGRVASAEAKVAPKAKKAASSK